MKIYLLLVSLIFVLISCENKNSEDPIKCNVNCKECINTLENIDGKTLMLNCFEKLGIEYALNDSTKAYAIPYEWDEKFMNENLNVKFCGSIYPNDVPLKFPDPNIGGPVYRLKIEAIELR